MFFLLHFKHKTGIDSQKVTECFHFSSLLLFHDFSDLMATAGITTAGSSQEAKAVKG